MRIICGINAQIQIKQMTEEQAIEKIQEINECLKEFLSEQLNLEVVETSDTIMIVSEE